MDAKSLIAGGILLASILIFWALSSVKFPERSGHDWAAEKAAYSATQRCRPPRMEQDPKINEIADAYKSGDAGRLYAAMAGASQTQIDIGVEVGKFDAVNEQHDYWWYSGPGGAE